MSCQQQEVKIPVNDNHGLTEVWDNSRIYILFNKKGNDTLADLKLGQTITTTHWLTAVDRRLKMKHLSKALEKILKKRHKKSIHSKEGTHAYFSYIDTTRQKVSFIDFDSIQLMPEYYTSSAYFDQYPKADQAYTQYHLRITPQKIQLNDSMDFSGYTKVRIADTINKILMNTEANRNNILYLNFDKEVYFDQFLNLYTFFKNNPVNKLKLSPKIFIFTP